MVKLKGRVEDNLIVVLFLLVLGALIGVFIGYRVGYTSATIDFASLDMYRDSCVMLLKAAGITCS